MAAFLLRAIATVLLRHPVGGRARWHTSGALDNREEHPAGRPCQARRAHSAGRRSEPGGPGEMVQHTLSRTGTGGAPRLQPGCRDSSGGSPADQLLRRFLRILLGLDGAHVSAPPRPRTRHFAFRPTNSTGSRIWRFALSLHVREHVDLKTDQRRRVRHGHGLAVRPDGAGAALPSLARRVCPPRPSPFRCSARRRRLWRLCVPPGWWPRGGAQRQLGWQIERPDWFLAAAHLAGAARRRQGRAMQRRLAGHGLEARQPCCSRTVRLQAPWSAP